MFSIFPSALAAEDEGPSEALAKLSDENFEWELTAGTEVEDERTESFWRYDNEELVYLEDRNEKHHCHNINFHLTEDSEPGEGLFKITRPDSLLDTKDLIIRIRRFRPGDQIGDTTSGWMYESLDRNGSYDLELFEWDSAWVYNFQFGTGSDDEDFVPESYTYRFMLGIARFEYMTWDSISYKVISGEYEYKDQSHSTDELFICNPNFDYDSPFDYNWLELYIKKDADGDAEVRFTVSCPDTLNNEQDIVAMVNDEIMELTNGSIEVSSREGEPAAILIQFGKLDQHDAFVPLTYEYALWFDIVCLERMTWENVEINIANDESECLIKYYPDRDKPLRTAIDTVEDKLNYIDLFVLPEDVAAGCNFTLTSPEDLSDLAENNELYIRYDKRNRINGSFSADSVFEPMGISGFTIQINEDDEWIHVFQFGTMKNNAEEEELFIPLSYGYQFIVNILPHSQLDWDNISYEPSAESIEIDEDNIIKYSVSDTNELLPDYKQSGYGVNAYILPVTKAPAGSRMTFQIHCPKNWDTEKYNVSVDYITNIRGAKSGDTATRDTIELEDGILSIPVDISMAFPVRWHRVTFYLQDSDGNLIQQSSRYTFDLIARDDSDTAVNAPVTVEGDKANSVIEEGSIQDKIQENPDADRIFIKAAYTDTGFVPSAPEVNVTLGKNDANAVIDGNKTLEIATPLGTIAVPSEAVAQAMGESDEDAASLRLKVQTRESEDISGSGNVNVEIIGVTLHRIVDGEESDAVPVQLADGQALTVTVITQKQTPVVVVYLPKNGGPIFHAQVNNVNDRVSFSTSHLSEFALLSYDEARKLGLVGTSSGGSGSSGGASHVTRQPGYTASGDKDTDTAPEAGRIRVDSTSNGSVDVSPRSPSRGDRVTLTVTPDAGYQLDNIEVLDEKDKPLRLDNPAENVYTFTMPSGDVTVSAQFVSEGTAPAPAPAAAENTARNASFADVKTTDWYSASVAFVTENGMMAGNNGYFSPNSSLTRAMIAQILYNMENASAAGSARFPDVYASDWFSDSVTWAVSQGYMNGYGSGSFGPNDAITREQLAAVFYSYSQRKGYDVSAAGVITSFTDSAAVSDWSEASVRWAVGAGLISGKAGGRLDPSGTASRAEVAQILMNFRQNIAK